MNRLSENEDIVASTAHVAGKGVDIILSTSKVNGLKAHWNHRMLQKFL